METAALFVLLFLFIGVGMPIAFAIGIASLAVLYFMQNTSYTVAATRVFGGMDSFPLMAIPFFILSGVIMNRSGLTQRIVDLASVLVGHFRAGLAKVTVVAAMIFAGVSGSGSADAAAIGSLMIPSMRRAGYPADFSVNLTAVAGSIGPIIPPSLIFVIYGSIVNVSIGRMFLGGIIPGVLIGLGLMTLAHFWCKRQGFGMSRGIRASVREVWIAFRGAIWALLTPLIILGGIVTGWFTATEAGVIAVVYSLVVGGLVTRTLHWREMPELLVSAALTSTVVMLIIGTGSLFGNLLTRLQFHELVTNALLAISPSVKGIFLPILFLLIILGAFMDETPMIIMLGPILAALATRFGYDPVHFGVWICATTMIGSVTPPVATILSVSCAIGNVPLSRVMWSVWPWLGILVAVSILIAYVPPLVLVVPNLLMPVR